MHGDECIGTIVGKIDVDHNRQKRGQTLRRFRAASMSGAHRLHRDVGCPESAPKQKNWSVSKMLAFCFSTVFVRKPAGPKSHRTNAGHAS